MTFKPSVLALALLTSASLSAQTPDPNQEIARLQAEVATLKKQLETQNAQRPPLGIHVRDVLRTKAQLGFAVMPLNGRAEVGFVGPMSPAATAGLRKGDELKRVNAQVISAADPMADVLSAMKTVEPGDTVRIEILRDGKPQVLQATAEARAISRVLRLDGDGALDPKQIEASIRAALADKDGLIPGTVDVQGVDVSGMDNKVLQIKIDSALQSADASLKDLNIDELVANAVSGAQANGQVMVLGPHGSQALNASRVMVLRSGLRGVELAPINPDLGRYFGTTSGALVVSEPRDPNSPLKAGDVIQSVDGKPVSEPREVYAALREATDRAVPVEVFRDKRKLALTLPKPGAEKSP
jgi:S1-C subfamily serine protease